MTYVWLLTWKTKEDKGAYTSIPQIMKGLPSAYTLRKMQYHLGKYGNFEDGLIKLEKVKVNR